MQHIKFSIIIPTRNRSKLLRETLVQLDAMKYSKSCFEVIVVDNAPRDRTTETLVDQLKHSTNLRLSYLQISETGSSVARNAGITQAKYAHCIFIDDDLQLAPEWLSAYESAWRKYPDSTCIGGNVGVVRLDKKALTPDQKKVLSSPDAWCLGATICPDRDEALFPTGALVSANLSWKKEHGTKKLFNETLGRSFTQQLQLGSEDYELSQRLILSEKKVQFVVDPALTVWNRVTLERFQQSYLNTRYWLHGMELALVEETILRDFPNSLPVYRGFLWWDLTHWPNCTTLLRRFLTNKREWIRLWSYLLNGIFITHAI